MEDFVEISKNLVRCRAVKIILLVHQNNYVGNDEQCCKKFLLRSVLATSLNVLHFFNLIKLFFQICT